MNEEKLCKYSIWIAYHESDNTSGQDLLYQNNSKELVEDLLPIFQKHFKFLNVYMHVNEEVEEDPLPF